MQLNWTHTRFVAQIGYYWYRPFESQIDHNINKKRPLEDKLPQAEDLGSWIFKEIKTDGLNHPRKLTFCSCIWEKQWTTTSKCSGRHFYCRWCCSACVTFPMDCQLIQVRDKSTELVVVVLNHFSAFCLSVVPKQPLRPTWSRSSRRISSFPCVTFGNCWWNITYLSA